MENNYFFFMRFIKVMIKYIILRKHEFFVFIIRIETYILLHILNDISSRHKKNYKVNCQRKKIK